MLHRPLYRFLGRFLSKNDRRKIASKILMEDSFSYSIRNANFVNSRSILFCCDIHPKNPQSSIANTSYLESIPHALRNLVKAKSCNDIPTIYVPSDGLPYFADHIIDKINFPFILVSGDSDLAIDESNLNTHLKKILENPKLVRWFAQNRNTDHPKLFSLPIGINIHNLWSNPLEWGGGFILPALQELQLNTISQEAPLFALREAKIFCNWHFSIDRADRRKCLEEIDRSICYFQDKPLPMAQTWELQSQFQFVLSPHGAGLDCHRTWEALILGCIPVIKKSSMDDLFADLPVMIVNDWSEIDANFLEHSKKLLESKTFNTQKLQMHYWRSLLKKN